MQLITNTRHQFRLTVTLQVCESPAATEGLLGWKTWCGWCVSCRLWGFKAKLYGEEEQEQIRELPNVLCHEAEGPVESRSMAFQSFPPSQHSSSSLLPSSCSLPFLRRTRSVRVLTEGDIAWTQNSWTQLDTVQRKVQGTTARFT